MNTPPNTPSVFLSLSFPYVLLTSLIKERYVSLAYLLLVRGVSSSQRKVRKRYVLKKISSLE